jgi:recombination protein RecT
VTQTVSTAVAQRQNTLANLIERQKGEIARALPRHLDPDRLARIATTVMRQTPQLGQADPASFLGALMTCAQLGLEPGPLGHAYLVPFRNGRSGTVEVTFIPGYRGLIDLARRSGQVQSVQARVVYDSDAFDYAFGLNPRLDHVPSGRLGVVTHAYAVVRYKGDEGADFDVMTKAEVDAIRARSKSSEKGPWVTDYAEMAKKTVLRRLLKSAPMSVEYQQAIAQDEQVRTRIDLDGLDIAPPEPDPEVAASMVDGEVVDLVDATDWPPTAQPVDAGDGA